MNPSLIQKVVFDAFSGAVSIYLFGKPNDWNIWGENGNNALVNIDFVTQGMNLQNIYAPSPSPSKFNAVICTHDDLQEQIPLVKSNAMMRRGCDADGTTLEKAQDACWINTADCPTVITYDQQNGLIIAAHAGRDSLIDRGRIAGKQPRTHETVVHTMVDRHGYEAMQRLQVFIACGIKSAHFEHRWDDKKYGMTNKAMTEDVIERWGRISVTGQWTLGRLALSEIIRSQFLNFGVPSENIAYDGIDTSSDVKEEGGYRWWSNRRGDGAKRNGVLVVGN